MSHIWHDGMIYISYNDIYWVTLKDFRLFNDYYFPSATIIIPLWLLFLVVVYHAFLGMLHPVARQVKLQNDRVMHQPVNHRCSGHRIFKDRLPFGEGLVTGNHHTPSFISLR